MLKGKSMQEDETSVTMGGPSEKSVMTWQKKLGHMSKQGKYILIEKINFWGLKKVSLPLCEHFIVSE